MLQQQDALDKEIDGFLKMNAAPMPKKVKPIPQAEAPSPNQGGVFESSFGEVQKGFRSKYGRDFEVTGGADTPMHKKLHSDLGRDIRVKDLSPEQGDWLINEGKAKVFDVRDFRKDWQKYGGSGPH